MAYHKQRLFEQIEIHLTAHPRISQAELERNLGVERHTIENLIKENKAMIGRIIRVSLTMVAFVLALSVFSQNLRKVSAGLCPDCGCPGGQTQCCSQGTIICYTA